MSTQRIFSALVLLSLACTLGDARAQGRYGEFRDWAIACDNRRDCRAMGFPGSEGTGGIGAIAVDRAAEGDAQPSLWIVVDRPADNPPADGTSVEVTADDRSLGSLTVGTGLVARDEDRLIFDLREETVGRAILEALRSAARLRFVFAAGPTLEVSLNGASAALLFMDERQRRVGTVTALVRRGDRPASAIPAPPAIAPEPATRADPAWRPLPDSLPGAVVRRVARSDDSCDAEDDRSEARAAGRLAADLVLVQTLCFRGAYNYSYRYHLWNDRTGRITPVAFPVPQGIETGVGQDILTNPDFEQDTLTIVHFSKGRGIGDCGSSGAWRWDGRAFRLVRYFYMPRCQGLLLDNWLALHRSE